MQADTCRGTFKSEKFPHFLVHGDIGVIIESMDELSGVIFVSFELKGLFRRGTHIKAKMHVKKEENKIRGSTFIPEHQSELSIEVEKIEQMKWKGQYTFKIHYIHDYGHFILHE